MIHDSHKSHSPSVTHRYCTSFFPKPPLAIEKSCLYIWHLIFSYNCFLNNLLERFTFLLLVFLFCLIHIAKLNLTHQSKVFLAWDFILLCLHCFYSSNISNIQHLGWIMNDLCCFCISLAICVCNVLIFSSWIRLGNDFWICTVKCTRMNYGNQGKLKSMLSLIEITTFS